MRMHKQTPSIASAFLRFTLIVSAVSIIGLGALWIGDEIYQFRKNSARLRHDYLELRKNEVRQEVELFQERIVRLRTELDAGLREDIRTRTEEAWAIADHLYRLHTGTKSRTEVEGIIREALRPIQFHDGKGYYFAVSLEGVGQLFEHHPEFESRNLLDLTDVIGEPFARDMVRIARDKGEGFYQYVWTKPGSRHRDHLKLAFVKRVPGLEWLVGTGAYLEDLETRLKKDILHRMELEQFGDHGYFFAGTLDGISLAGPARGRNMLDVTDANGQKVVRKLIATAKDGGGFVGYVMPALNSTTEYSKLSYVTMVHDWEWYFGAGVNVEAIERDIALRRSELKSSVIKHGSGLLGLALVVLLVQYLAARRATASLRDGVAMFMDFFRAAGDRGTALEPESQPYAEMQELARSANAMIHGRRLAEKALQESETRYRRLVENIQDSIFLADQSGRIIDANEQACVGLGYTLEELTSMHVWEVEVDFTEADFTDNITKLDEKEPVMFQGRHRKKNGDSFPVEIKVMTFREDGKTMVLGVARDITDRVKAEESLRQSETKFVRLFQSSPEAIFLTNLNDKRILEVNDSCVRLFGHPREKFLGLTTREVGIYAHEEDREFILNELRQGRPVNTYELQMRRGDGKVMDCVLSSEVLTIGGEPHSLTSVVDITERKKMQEMMIQSEKMISVGGIATGIAHEINNPLGIIMQAAENLNLRTQPDFQKNREAAGEIGLDLELMARYMKVRKLDLFIRDIREAGVRAAFIVRNMLDFSRKNASKRTMCRLAELAGKALSLAQSDYDLKRHYDFRNIRVDIREEDGVPSIFCNETEIEQVFLNFFRNAAQAMAQAPESVKDPHISVRISTPREGWVRVRFEDNGPGIPPETRRRIFEPFFTTKKPGEGTGLGLSVSYFIVTSGHGGRIRVSRGDEGGACFTVDLPVQPGTSG
jgi:PAS domain S-box-containing protein